MDALGTTVLMRRIWVKTAAGGNYLGFGKVENQITFLNGMGFIMAQRKAYYWILFWRSVLCACALIGTAEIGEAEAPSLSVGDLIDVIRSADGSRSAIRGQFLAELVQSYECHVQTRWRGLEVVTEKEINELTYIDALQIPENEIQAADYVICGNYANSNIHKELQGFVVGVGLMGDSNRPALQGSFTARDAFELPAAMAKETARILSLASRTSDAMAKTTSPKDLIWVVQPFLMCAAGWGVGGTMDSKLSLQVEASLQQEGVVKKLVDRQALDTILKEHNLSDLSQHGFRKARMLSALKKADILLTGQVAPWRNHHRIDLFLIDSRTGCLLAARTATGVTEKELSAKCVQLATLLAETPIVMPAGGASSPARRRREAETLTSQAYYPEDPSFGSYFTRTRSELESLINNAEGSYLLVHDDDAFMCRNISDLWAGYKKRGWWNTPLPGDDAQRFEFKTLECMQRTACLINQALQHIEPSSVMPAPLLYRADALMYAGRYQEALDLAQRHLSHSPDIQPEWAQEILAYSHFKLGHIDIAAQFAKRSSAKMPESFLNYIVLGKAAQDSADNELQMAAKADAAAALEIYRKLMSREGSWVSIRDWKRYLDLLRKVEGPDEALNVNKFLYPGVMPFANCVVLNELPGQVIHPDQMLKAEIARCPDSWEKCYLMMLHMALCHADRGADEKAYRMGKDVMAATEAGSFVWGQCPFFKEIHDEAAQLCERIVAKRGPVKELWKSGQEVRTFGDRYCIYIAPQGAFNQTRLKATMNVLTSFYGTNCVRLLPSIPAPASRPGNAKYNYGCAPLFDGVYKNLVVPDDALHVVVVNELDMEYCGLLCSGQVENFETPSALSPVIISYVPFSPGVMPEQTRINDFCWKIISSLHYIYAGEALPWQRTWAARTGYGLDRETCRSWACIFHTGLWWREIPQAYRLLMCPKCQKEYESADFEKLHNDLMRHLKSKGVKIIKAGTSYPVAGIQGQGKPGKSVLRPHHFTPGSH